jgi:WS/DGAT/MGAT family acyltransferase
MTDRLNPLDVSFLYMETPTTAMHVGGVCVFASPDGGFDYDRLVELICQRISLVPRYRQKVKWVPGRLANPVWVDDAEFDVAYHVRRSALPRPGNDAQLRDLVGRLQSRQLDRNRPLWEIYLVEGLEHDRVAVITKTHHAMVDGVAAVDVKGGAEREVHVDLDLAKVDALKLSPLSILDALRAENITVPAGHFDEGIREIAVRTVGEFKTVDEIGNLIVATAADGSTSSSSRAATPLLSPTR